MNSAKLNMVAGAVLSVLLVTMGLGIVSDIIFHAEDPAIPGYEIVVADADSSDAPAEEAPQVEPIAVRLASASVENGEKLTRACAACHDFTQGGANKVGPALWGLLGRAPASHEGFRYSGAMQEYGQTAGAWDYENLDAFLAAPKAVVSGTSMGYAGMKKPADRADLVAYLRTLADSPMPLPEAPAAESEAPAAETAAPAEGAEAPAANQ